MTRESPTLGALIRKEPVFIHVDMPLSEAAARLKEADQPILIVLDGDEIVGTLSAHDLVSEVARKHASPARLRVQDVMDHRVPHCREDEDMECAARALAENEARALVVLNGREEIKGVVTAADIAAAGPGPEMAERLVEAESKARKARPAKTDPTGGRRREDAPGTPPTYSQKPHLKRNG